jgi:hypothetical protein
MVTSLFAAPGGNGGGARWIAVHQTCAAPHTGCQATLSVATSDGHSLWSGPSAIGWSNLAADARGTYFLRMPANDTSPAVVTLVRLPPSGGAAEDMLALDASQFAGDAIGTDSNGVDWFGRLPGGAFGYEHVPTAGAPAAVVLFPADGTARTVAGVDADRIYLDDQARADTFTPGPHVLESVALDGSDLRTLVVAPHGHVVGPVAFDPRAVYFVMDDGIHAVAR